MKMRKLAMLFTLSALFMCTVALIQPVHSEGETGTLAEILDRGYLIVGSDTTYPPFESYNEETKMAEGFDIDIAHQIAAAIGVNLSVKESAWDPIIPNLQAEKFDMIISAMTITAEREQEVDFSRWYYKSFQAVLVPTDNPLSITDETDLNQTLTIGLQSGTTSALWCDEHLNDSATVNTYDTILDAIAALKGETIDVVLGDYAVLAQDELESGETMVVATYSPEDFGIAMRTGDTDLIAAVNDAIDGLLGTDENAPEPNDLYNIMYVKWFGVEAPDYDGTVTSGTIPQVSVVVIAAPGFEWFTVIFAVAAIVPVLRKRRK